MYGVCGFSKTNIFQHFRHQQFGFKPILHLIAGQYSGSKPAKRQCLLPHLCPHLVLHPDCQRLGGGRHPEEGAQRLELPDHLRLPGQHGHHVPLRCPPVTLVHWLAIVGLPSLQSNLQNVKTFVMTQKLLHNNFAGITLFLPNYNHI